MIVGLVAVVKRRFGDVVVVAVNVDELVMVGNIVVCDVVFVVIK